MIILVLNRGPYSYNKDLTSNLIQFVNYKSALSNLYSRKHNLLELKHASNAALQTTNMRWRQNNTLECINI